jgi:hypothetical protein
MESHDSEFAEAGGYRLPRRDLWRQLADRTAGDRQQLAELQEAAAENTRLMDPGRSACDGRQAAEDEALSDYMRGDRQREAG